MMKIFNCRESVSSQEDTLPERMFQPLPDGKQRGAKVDQKDFAQAVKDYYALMGWDFATGKPGKGKLLELDLSWAEQEI